MLHTAEGLTLNRTHTLRAMQEQNKKNVWGNKVEIMK